MLEKIILLKLPVQKALLDFGVNINISDQDFAMIESIAKALSPIKITVEALCRRDSNLITAETTINFLINELKMSPSYYNLRNRCSEYTELENESIKNNLEMVIDTSPKTSRNFSK